MKEEGSNNFIDGMKKTIYEAGEVALEYQGKVKNEGKKITSEVRDNDYIQQQRSAKTVVDENVQEIILKSAAGLLDAKKIYLDAEEETPSKKLFASDFKKITLVIDPIDGTLAYILGKNFYNICVSLIEEGDILTALVYFPVKKELYFIKEGKAFYENGNVLQELTSPKNKNEKSVYVNCRVDPGIVEKLNRFGYEVTNDASGIISWPEALIGCIKGEYGVCIFDTPQVRDVLLGAIISKIPNGRALDWQGNITVWPSGGRIPKILFGFGDTPNKIIGCLNE